MTGYRHFWMLLVLMQLLLLSAQAQASAVRLVETSQAKPTAIPMTPATLAQQPPPQVYISPPPSLSSSSSSSLSHYYQYNDAVYHDSYPFTQGVYAIELCYRCIQDGDDTNTGLISHYNILGQAEPSHVEFRAPGERVKVYGSFGRDKRLGPMSLTVEKPGEWKEQLTKVHLHQRIHDLVVVSVSVDAGHVTESSSSTLVVAPVAPVAPVDKTVSSMLSEPVLTTDAPAMVEVASAKLVHQEEDEVVLETLPQQQVTTAASSVHLVVVVDTSGSVTSPRNRLQKMTLEEQEDTIRETLAETLEAVEREYESSVPLKVDVVYFANEAFHNQSYSGQSGGASRSIEFFHKAPEWYTNWEAGLSKAEELHYRHLGQKQKSTPEDESSDLVVLMLVSGPPTTTTAAATADVASLDPLTRAKQASKRLQMRENRRVAVVGVGSATPMSAIQSVSSGKRAGQDYALVEQGWNNPRSVNRAIRSILSSQLCIESERDVCGVCFGDGSLCRGCDGVLGSGTEFDECGVCGGDGSLCPRVGSCTHNVTLSVSNGNSGNSSLAIQWVGEDRVRFRYGVHAHAEHYHLGFYHPHALYSLDNTDDSCSLESRWELQVVANQAFGETTLLEAVFTLDELLNTCHADPHITKRLVDTSAQEMQVISGLFYVSLDTTSEDNGDQADPVWNRFEQYEFEIWVAHGGALYIEYFVRPIHVDVKWIKNVPLACGDVAVLLETYTEALPEDNSYNVLRLRLGDAEVLLDHPHDTGAVPFHLEDPSPPCEYVHIHDDAPIACKQSWKLRTYDALGVVDFSGHKYLQFTVYSIDGYNGATPRHHIPVSTLLLHLDLEIVRHSSHRVDNQILPWIKLSSSSLDQQQTMMVVELGLSDHEQRFQLVTDQLFLCSEAPSSGASELASLVPYDVSRPDSTGCNTPNAQAVTLLYDRTQQQPQKIQHPQTSFSFSLEDLDLDPQLVHGIQAHWHVEPLYGQQQENDREATLSSSVAYQQLRRDNHMRLVQQKLDYDSHQAFVYKKRAYLEPTDKRLVAAHAHLYSQDHAVPVHADHLLPPQHRELLALSLQETIDYAAAAAASTEAFAAAATQSKKSAHYHHGAYGNPCNDDDDHHDDDDDDDDQHSSPCHYHYDDFDYYDNDPAYGVLYYTVDRLHHRCADGQTWYAGNCVSSYYAFYGNTWIIFGFFALLLIVLFIVYAYNSKDGGAWGSYLCGSSLLEDDEPPCGQPPPPPVPIVPHSYYKSSSSSHTRSYESRALHSGKEHVY